MSGDDLIALSATAAGFAVFLPLLLTHGMHQAQEVSEAWRRLADRHRLQFNGGARVTHKMNVSGLIGGREFLLARAGSNNNQSVSMELTLNGELPPGLRVQTGKASSEALSAALTASIGGDDAGSGDPHLNERLKIRANDPDDLSGYLTSARAKAASTLVDLGGELEHGKIKMAVTKDGADLEALDTALRALAEMAPVLDTA